MAARSAAHGINISRVAEAALDAAFEAAEVAKIREDINQATRFTDAYVAEHGYPFPEAMDTFMPDLSETDDAA